MEVQPLSVGTVGAVVRNVARATPNATAAVVAGTPHTFAEIDAAGDRAAALFLEDGAAPGDALLALCDTSFATLAVFVGAARAGLVFAPLNPRFDDLTIEGVTEALQPAVVLSAGGSSRGVDLSTWLDRPTPPDPLPVPAIADEDGHAIFFTSGSTGLPKAAVISHRVSVLRSHPGSQLEHRGPALCPYPLFHMAGWTITLQQWHARASVVFTDDTTPGALAASLRDGRIERFNAVPALWVRIAEHLGEAAVGAFPDLRFADTGTSPTSPELLARIAAMAPNAEVRVFYGSTEAGNVASLHHEDLARKPGSCGVPGPLTEVRVSELGELQVRGPLLFDGYHQGLAGGDDPFDDGWYRTGDLAEVDADGYLSITGRLGGVIRTGGEAVTPSRVEDALLRHPAVSAAAVFGMPDEQWGEIVAAVVADRPVGLEELRSHFGPDGPDPLPAYQHPRALLVIDELPRTQGHDKIDRTALRGLARSQAEAEPGR